LGHNHQRMPKPTPRFAENKEADSTVIASERARIRATRAKPRQITSDFQNLSSPKIKNILLHNSVKQNYNSRHPGPHEGRFAIVTMRWAGERWTLWRQARFSRRTKTPRRTAKSCGPGAAMVALSS